MPLKLNVEITNPLDANDHELLTGGSVMLLAVANHELAKAKFPEAFGGDEPAEETPAPCGMEDHAVSTCVNEAGHRGRHRFRPAATPDTALVN